jgi:hypothetical protein
LFDIKLSASQTLQHAPDFGILMAGNASSRIHSTFFQIFQLTELETVFSNQQKVIPTLPARRSFEDLFHLPGI